MADKALLVMLAKARAAGNSIGGTALLKRLPMALLGGLVWAGLYAGTKFCFSYMLSIEFVGEMLGSRAVSMVYFALMCFVFLSSLVTSISTSFLSNDLVFLRSLPLSSGEILRVKAVQTVMSSAWMVFAFVPPVLAGTGAAYHAPAGYYLLVVPLFCAFVIVSSGWAMLLSHLLVRIFPARLIRDFFLLAGLGLFIGAWLALRSAVPADTGNPVELIGALTSFRADSPYLPHRWMTAVALSLVSGRGAGLLDCLLLVSNGAFAMMLSLTVGEALYPANLDRVTSAHRAGKAGGKVFYPGRTFAVSWKDAKVFFRDTAQWSQLAIVLALVFVYVYNFRALPIESLDGAGVPVREAMALVNVLMAGLVLSAVAARFVYASVSLEGRAFWTIRVAPIGMKRFLAGKYLFGLVPVSAVTLAVVVLGNLAVGAGMRLSALSFSVVLLLSLSVSGLGTGLGALWPKFDHDNIASVSMSLGAMVFMLAAVCLTVATVVPVAWAYWRYLKAGGPALAETVLCVTLVLALNFAAFYFPMKAGLRKLYNTGS